MLVWRRWFWLLFFALVAVLELGIAFRRVMARDPYAAGDWLINYSAGFVRRGLPGEAILWLAGKVHADYLWAVFGLQAICLLVYLGFACGMVVRDRGSFVMAAMILSPATVAFEALNPAEGLRKEVLLFAVLAVLAGVGFVERIRGWVLSLLLTFTCVGMVLSHESLAIYLPYLFAAMWLRRDDLRETARIMAGPLVGSLLAGIAVMRSSGDLNVATTICRSLGESFNGLGDRGLCGGSIAWLQESLSEAHRQVSAQARSFHFVAIYGVLALLSLAPAAVISWRLRAGRELKVIGACAALSGLGSLALFYSGVDWGRWIHIHAVCLMLVLLAALGRGETRVVHAKGWALGVAVYATCWILPVTIMSSSWPKFGMMGAVWRLW